MRPEGAREYTEGEVVELVVQAARDNGLIPTELLGLVRAEGLDVYAERPADPSQWREYWDKKDISFGLGQKNLLYTEEFAQWCRAHGREQGDPTYPGDEAVEAVRAVYFDPHRALEVAASGYRYWRYDPAIEPLHAMVAYNGPVYYKELDWRTSPALRTYAEGLLWAAERLKGMTAVHVTTETVNFRASPVDGRVLKTLPAGTAVTGVDPNTWRHVRLGSGESGWVAAEFLELVQDFTEPRPTRAYDPDFPRQAQVQSWTCSIRTAMMMLASVGVDVSPEEAQEALEGRWVNQEVGLLDASGAGLAEALGEAWGVPAYNVNPASWDDVTAVAGQAPVGLGLRRWGGAGGHWVAVRRAESDHLALANPASGPTYGHAFLTPSWFEAWGPASMVVIGERK